MGLFALVSGVWDAFTSSLKTQTAAWMAAFIIGIFTIFSAQITERVKFALNRADLRTKQYEELATEVSKYIFSAELLCEFIEHDWTTKKSMTDLGDYYNKSVMELRAKEFVYHSWIQKFWGQKQAGQFDAYIKSVREFDSTIHSLNDEFEAVNINDSKKKIDKNRAEEALKIMKPALEKMRQEGTALLAEIK